MKNLVALGSLLSIQNFKPVTIYNHLNEPVILSLRDVYNKEVAVLTVIDSRKAWLSDDILDRFVSIVSENGSSRVLISTKKEHVSINKEGNLTIETDPPKRLDNLAAYSASIGLKLTKTS